MSNGIDPWVETLLLKAAEDETAIQIDELPDGPFGFHAQQAVEKLLKALLSQVGVAYDRTHDVTKLAQQLSSVGENLPTGTAPLSELNQFAVVYRYDSIPDLAIPDRPAIIETVRLIREHIAARIAARSTAP